MEFYDEYSKKLLTDGEIHDFDMAAAEEENEEEKSKEHHAVQRKHAGDIVAAAHFVLAQEAADSSSPTSSSARATIIHQNNWKPSLVKQQQRQNQLIRRQVQDQKRMDNFVYDVNEFDALLSHTRRHHMIGQQVWYEIRGERRRITDSEARRLNEKFENEPRLSKSAIKPRILVKVEGTTKNEFGQYQCRLASLADIRKNVNTKRDSNNKQQQQQLLQKHLQQQHHHHHQQRQQEKQDNQTKHKQSNGNGNGKDHRPSAVVAIPKKRKTSSSPQPPTLTPSSPGKYLPTSFAPIVTPPTIATAASIGIVANNHKSLRANGFGGKTLRVILSEYTFKLQQLEQEYYNKNPNASTTHFSVINGGTAATTATIMYQIHDFRKTLDAFLALPYTDQLPHTLMELALEGYHQIVNATRTLWTRLRRLCNPISSPSIGGSTSTNDDGEDGGDSPADGGEDMDTSPFEPPSSPGRNGPQHCPRETGNGRINSGSNGNQQKSWPCNGGPFWSLGTSKHTAYTSERFGKDVHDDDGSKVTSVDATNFDDSVETVTEPNGNQRGLKNQNDSLNTEGPCKTNPKDNYNDNDVEDDDDEDDGPDNDRGGAAAIVGQTASHTVEMNSSKPESNAKSKIHPALSPWKEPPFDCKPLNHRKVDGNRQRRPKASLRDSWIKASCDYNYKPTAAVAQKHSVPRPSLAHRRGNKANLISKESTRSGNVIRTHSKQQPEPRRTPSLLGVDVSASATSYMLMCTKNSSGMKRVRSTGCVKTRPQMRHNEKCVEARETAGTSSLVAKFEPGWAPPFASSVVLKHNQSEPTNTSEPSKAEPRGTHPDHREKAILQRIKDMRLANKQVMRTPDCGDDDRSKSMPQRCELPQPSFYQEPGNDRPGTSNSPGWKSHAKFGATANAGEGSGGRHGSLKNSISATTVSLGSLKAAATFTGSGTRRHKSSSDLGPGGGIDPSKSLYRLW